MDQLQRVQDILKRVTYKPGWSVEAMRIDYSEPSVYKHDWNRVYLRVTVRTKSIENGDMVLINGFNSLMDIDIAPLNDEQIIEYFIHRAIWEMEEHEYHEWFKLDGICVFDPHPELKEKMA